VTEVYQENVYPSHGAAPFHSARRALAELGAAGSDAPSRAAAARAQVVSFH
jgi:hypothetical protein